MGAQMHYFAAIEKTVPFSYAVKLPPMASQWMDTAPCISPT